MLKGPNVVLRALEREDLPRFHTFNNDLAVELAGGGDPPMPQAFARLEADYNQRTAGGGRDGMDFAIEVDGRFIGICALFNQDSVARTCELGITIGDHDYWGRGYGREAVTLLVDYAFKHHNLRKVWLRVHGRNIRAQKAYAAAGFTEEGRLKAHVYSDGAFDDLVMMSIFRDSA